MRKYKKLLPRGQHFKSQEALKLYQKSNFLVEPLWGVKPELMPHLNYDGLVAQLDKIMKQFPKKSEILIINGNQGFIALHLANLGHKITVVEPNNDELIRILRKNSKMEKSIELIKSKDLFEIVDLSNEFDLIICAETFLHLSQDKGIVQAKQFFKEMYEKFNYILSIELAADSFRWWRQHYDDINIYGEFTEKYSDIVINNRIEPISMVLISKSNPRNLTIFKSEPINLITKSYPHDGRNDNIKIYESKTKIYKIVSNSKRVIHNPEKEKARLDSIHPQIRHDLNLPEIQKLENDAGESVFIRKRFRGESIDNIAGGQSKSIEKFVTIMCSYSASGYFHNDLRPWNVLFDRDEINLVDFETLSTMDQDPSRYPQWIPMLAICNYLSQDDAKTWKLDEMGQISEQHIDYRHPVSQIYYEKSWYLLSKNKKRILKLNFINTEQTVIEFLQILNENFSSIQKYWNIGKYGVL